MCMVYRREYMGPKCRIIDPKKCIVKNEHQNNKETCFIDNDQVCNVSKCIKYLNFLICT